ncbi:MAG: methyl-accepting chemotaxis protein [Woeseiaceae bacterium]
MAKKAANSKLFNFSAIAVPLLLILAAVAVWLTHTPPVSDVRGGPSPALAAAVSATALGDENGVAQLASLVRSESPTGQAATISNDLLSKRENLIAFRGAADRLIETTDVASQLLESAGDTSALDGVRDSLALIRTQAFAMRGEPSAAPQQATDLRRVTDDLSELAAALNGDSSSLDVAALDDASLSSALLDQVFVLQSAASVMESESTVFADANRIAAGFPAVSGASVSAPPASGIANMLNPFMPWLAIGLIGGALLLVAGLLAGFVRDAHLRHSAIEQADQNERNQQAILRLLDELGSLADGDLTVEATVTEDITGAIADSINYAIEALRELVTTIDGTAAMVDAATRQTETTAVHMNRSAQKQALEIAAATESITAIASSIEEVSGNAERSSDVARHSVDVAHKGGDAVRRTIEGMNTIRETIQETSKRIKRLGESSQEIGNIVELINDIAEQTNILALNASIQASMAGEAGRGFAVVADEVQRLAERSTNATKQIEVLVRTIQADTNEAVVSMERSTTDVVGGALLAENAGAALDEIEQVSNQIASLVQNIYGSARQQSQAATDISRRTVALREISGQTGEATNATTSSIAKLAQLAGELRKSVSGFRLPESASVTRITRAAPDANDADSAREAI